VVCRLKKVVCTGREVNPGFPVLLSTLSLNYRGFPKGPWYIGRSMNPVFEVFEDKNQV
jgi:hypothetical protein